MEEYTGLIPGCTKVLWNQSVQWNEDSPGLGLAVILDDISVANSSGMMRLRIGL